jgi:hypothetical protein
MIFRVNFLAAWIFFNVLFALVIENYASGENNIGTTNGFL